MQALAAKLPKELIVKKASKKEEKADAKVLKSDEIGFG